MASKILTNYFPEISSFILGRPKPTMVTVNLTNRCNQKCIYCEIGSSKTVAEKSKLTVEDLKWVIDEMALNNLKKLSLCGGEPFLFEGIFEIVEYAFKNKIRCSITSNGMTVHRLDEKEINSLKKCEANINLSIDSFENDTNSLTRGTPQALENALKSIQKLREAGISVTVLTVISKYNFRSLFQFFTIAYEKGIQQILFQPVIYYSNYPELLPVEQKSNLNVGTKGLDELMEQLNKIKTFERKHTIKTNVYRILPWIKPYLTTAAAPQQNWFFSNVLRKFYCRDVYAIIDINYDGGIQPCGLAMASITIHENRHRGLLSLWSEATQDLRADLQNGQYPTYCNGCCHHFSRNMLASIMKYPIRNSSALFSVLALLLPRIGSGILKLRSNKK
jgi:MoaA/NifB/PqqE/SkfB family radical SAM enzyme